MGLTVSGRDTQILENRFKKLDTGILLFVEDFDFGSAINTALDENRFEHVAVDVMTSPGASFGIAAAKAVQGPSNGQRYRFFHQPLP